MKNSLFTLNKTQENTKFIACYPAPGKCQWIACFLESFSIVIPSARTLHFPSIFPQNYQWWMPWKNDVCRLFSCFTKTLVYTLFSWTFFYSFPELANHAFFKRFPTDSLTANAIKTWCLSIVFLLHENASVYLVFLNVFYSFPVRTNAAFSKRVHTQLLTVKAMKTCCSSIVFLLLGNGSEQLSLFTWMFSVVFVSTRALYFLGVFTQNY